MCGIAGLIGLLPADDARARVERTIRALAHRGPDGDGFFVQPPERDRRGIALGHRRLAIIDLSPAAAQPMSTADGRYTVVFNGEIYNYLELRSELQSAGDIFHTASDTEVLLAGFARWGSDVVDRLAGMFAFAIVDRLAGTVWLARDPFGMKPLYHATGPHGWGFASEPAELLALVGLRPAAHPDGVADYLVHGLTDHRAGTMFDGVTVVPAASVVRVSLCDARPSDPVRYWTPSAGRVDDRPPDALARSLRELFLDSVRLHLRSDVRVGTLLSGGIDSSAIVMAMREVGGARLDICTFSYIADGGAPSEERWIDVVNAAANAIPHKLHIARERWEAEADRLAIRQGEPFGSIAIHAQSALFQHAAEHGVRVLLDGQGADELFAGYTSFRAVRAAAHLLRGELGRAARLVSGLMAGGGSWKQTFRTCADAGAQLLPPSLASNGRRSLRGSGIADDAWLRAHRGRAREERRATGTRWLHERLLHAVQAGSLPGLLRVADRGAMMHGVESRLPFLTKELAEFALSLPDHLLVADSGVGKAIFRQAMRGLVPDVVLDRREKLGFAVPLRDWLLGSRYARDLAADGAALPCVNGARVRGWIADLDARRPLRDAPVFLMWRVIGFAHWVRACGVSLPE